MGDYNTHAPQILGQEWVGIIDEDMTFTPSVNSLEVGHRFTTTASRTLQDARFYINDWPPGRALGQVFMASIYPAGKEEESGPVQSVIIPCNAVLVSGSGATGSVLSVADPSDNEYIFLPGATVNVSASFYFATNSYAQLLNGKRIVEVNFLYTLAASAGGFGPSANPLPPSTEWGSLATGRTSSDSLGLGLATVTQSQVGRTEISQASLGEIDHYWTSTSPVTTSERMPWKYSGLQNFEISASGKVFVRYVHPAVYTWNGYLGYAALEVRFCEETRVAYGAKAFGQSGTFAYTPYNMTTNVLTIRDTTYTANPVLAAGNYTLLISSANLGNIAGQVGVDSRKVSLSQYPDLNGLRQLYAVPNHTGIQLNVTQAVGETFTVEEVQVLPQLSLHVSGGAPVNEVHVYGRQAAAQVYGTITATQEILDSAAGGANSYPWVRFYARRFGETTVPLKLDSPTITGSGLSVQITPTEWDALPEIVNGWKEVTLRFTTAPTMGTGTNPQWRWSATGELAGNRWEVLGVTAPALSGTPGNLLNLVPSTQQLSAATYGQPSAGSTINLGWIPQYAPPVSATADDATSDAALMFARDMPTITGFSASNEEQEILGIGLDCDVDPCCIPTAIDYVELNWSGSQGVVLWDSFSRTVSSGWGSANTGQSYTTSGGVAGDYAVANGFGTHNLNGNKQTFTGNNWTDVDVTVLTRLDQVATGASIINAIMFRRLDSSNFYTAELVFNTDSSLQARLRKTVATVATTLATYNIGSFAHSTSATYYIHVRAVGTMICVNVWPSTEDEPDVWQIQVVDSSLTTGAIGLRSVVSAGNTNVGAFSYYDELYAVPFYLVGSQYEIQRMDTVDATWQTIMKTSNLTLTSFNDYEARVGILTSYRIRIVDAYDFEGPWSSTATATVPEPGVTIGCEGGHLLIFTSNELQDGSINLAYSSVWEDGDVVEGFVFPEAQFVQLQAMYNRDFFTAFRPTERGGEQFSRTVLVQAAAISPETLADFTSLRDMAWADVSYVCVRDEDGNRWFATVLVPTGKVLRDRRLYLAPVDIIEVTDTPSQVDPT